MKKSPFINILWLIILLFSCKKDEPNNPIVPPAPSSFSFNTLKVDGVFNGFDYKNTSTSPIIKLSFAAVIDKNSIANGISFRNTSGLTIPYSTSFEQNDSTLVIQPSQPLDYLTKYTIAVNNSLLSNKGGKLLSEFSISLTTNINIKDKFTRISDEQLLDKVQQQTFKYFWDFGHPVSGLARERNTSGDIVTSGGSGFGIMALIVGIERNFISRQEGLSRLNTIVDFLQNKAQRYHGAFPHWLNGATGQTIAFSTKDNGADLVETSYLIQGLLTARQYFNQNTTTENNLRNRINQIWQDVEWDWFTQNNQEVLYWHWSPTYNWDMNMKIAGWNESLITYLLAAASPSHTISKAVYDKGWARNGQMANNTSYYGIKLPLGPTLGGPMFFAHYSFLGINPNGLSDQYANYGEQNKAHALINYNYCKANPKQYAFYGENCWGLTASDNENGYAAHEPTNDLGVISPTAALASFPYTPNESMKALHFFYYTLGDKIWKEYGFVDAFNMNKLWFANSFLAIDQGPIIIMIENHRTQLLWKLFMSAPEVQNGLSKLSFKTM